MKKPKFEKLALIKEDISRATLYLTDLFENDAISLLLDKKEYSVSSVAQMVEVSTSLQEEGYTEINGIRILGNQIKFEVFKELKDDKALEKLAQIFEKLATDLRRCKNETV